MARGSNQESDADFLARMDSLMGAPPSQAAIAPSASGASDDNAFLARMDAMLKNAPEGKTKTKTLKGGVEKWAGGVLKGIEGVPLGKQMVDSSRREVQEMENAPGIGVGNMQMRSPLQPFVAHLGGLQAMPIDFALNLARTVGIPTNGATGADFARSRQQSIRDLMTERMGMNPQGPLPTDAAPAQTQSGINNAFNAMPLGGGIRGVGRIASGAVIGGGIGGLTGFIQSAGQQAQPNGQYNPGIALKDAIGQAAAMGLLGGLGGALGGIFHGSNQPLNLPHRQPPVGFDGFEGVTGGVQPTPPELVSPRYNDPYQDRLDPAHIQNIVRQEVHARLAAGRTPEQIYAEAAQNHPEHVDAVVEELQAAHADQAAMQQHRGQALKGNAQRGEALRGDVSETMHGPKEPVLVKEARVDRAKGAARAASQYMDYGEPQAPQRSQPLKGRVTKVETPQPEAPTQQAIQGDKNAPIPVEHPAEQPAATPQAVPVSAGANKPRLEIRQANTTTYHVYVDGAPTGERFTTPKANGDPIGSPKNKKRYQALVSEYGEGAVVRKGGGASPNQAPLSPTPKAEPTAPSKIQSAPTQAPPEPPQVESAPDAAKEPQAPPPKAETQTTPAETEKPASPTPQETADSITLEGSAEKTLDEMSSSEIRALLTPDEVKELGKRQQGAVATEIKALGGSAEMQKAGINKGEVTKAIADAEARSYVKEREPILKRMGDAIYNAYKPKGTSKAVLIPGLDDAVDNIVKQVFKRKPEGKGLTVDDAITIAGLADDIDHITNFDPVMAVSERILQGKIDQASLGVEPVETRAGRKAFYEVFHGDPGTPGSELLTDKQLQFINTTRGILKELDTLYEGGQTRAEAANNKEMVRWFKQKREEVMGRNPDGLRTDTNDFDRILAHATSNFYLSHTTGAFTIHNLHAIDALFTGMGHTGVKNYSVALGEVLRSLATDREVFNFLVEHRQPPKPVRELKLQGAIATKLHANAILNLWENQVNARIDRGIEKVKAQKVAKLLEGGALLEGSKVASLRAASIVKHGNDISYQGGGIQLLRDLASKHAGKTVDLSQDVINSTYAAQVELLAQGVGVSPLGTRNRTSWGRAFGGRGFGLIEPFVTMRTRQSGQIVRFAKKGQWGKVATQLGTIALIGGRVAVPLVAKNLIDDNMHPADVENMYRFIDNMALIGNLVHRKTHHIQPDGIPWLYASFDSPKKMLDDVQATFDPNFTVDGRQLDRGKAAVSTFSMLQGGGSVGGVTSLNQLYYYGKAFDAGAQAEEHPGEPTKFVFVENERPRSRGTMAEIGSDNAFGKTRPYVTTDTIREVMNRFLPPQDDAEQLAHNNYLAAVNAQHYLQARIHDTKVLEQSQKDLKELFEQSMGTKYDKDEKRTKQISEPQDLDLDKLREIVDRAMAEGSESE